MATITTHLDFVGDINIPNVDPNKPNGQAFALFIEKYELKLLTEVLGYKMATELLAAFNTDPKPTSGVWFDLWNGKDYTDKHGRANHWPGFLTIGYNLIANYIYTIWMEDSATYTTSGGEKVTNSANSTNTDGNRKIVNAWNQMVEWLLIMDDFIVQNADDYPDYIGRSCWFEYIGNRNFFERDNLLGI